MVAISNTAGLLSVSALLRVRLGVLSTTVALAARRRGRIDPIHRRASDFAKRAYRKRVTKTLSRLTNGRAGRI